MRLVLTCAISLSLTIVGAGLVYDTRAPDPSGSRALLQLERRSSRCAEDLVRQAGGRIVSRRLLIWSVPQGPAGRIVPELRRRGALRNVEQDRVVPRVAAAVGFDPLSAGQWWVDRVGALEPPAEAGVPITVVDSGLDLAHPEFAGRPNTVVMNEQTITGDRGYHGTAVASVVAAPLNGVGITGIYPNAALRVWDASPAGALRISDVIAGIEAAAAIGPGVINLSLGGSRSRLEGDAIADALRRGSLIVAAAGNGRAQGSEPTFPANLPHVLTVASTDRDDHVSRFSSPGPGMDVAAPGEDIPVSLPGSATGFSILSGTSFAAPIVSGAVAWIWTRRADLDTTQVFELVRRSARDLAPVGRDADTGFGLLDIPAALTAAASTPDPQEPNESIDQISPNGVFPTERPPISVPGRARASLTARLDVVDDPRDIYRVWVPARGRLEASVVSARDIRMRLLERGLSSRFLRKGMRSVLTIANRARSGRYAYLNVFLPVQHTSRSVAYTLVLRPKRL